MAQSSDGGTTTEPVQRSRWGWPTWLAVALLIAVVWGVYGQVVGFEFLAWGDPTHVVGNRHVQTPTWSGVAQLWQTPLQVPYTPLAHTVLAAAGWLSEVSATEIDPHPRPLVFHTLNLLVHTLCVLLVFGLLRTLLGRSWVAVAGALVFAIHPLQVESVAWISQTRVTLASLFGLLALGAYVRSTGIKSVLWAPGGRWIALGEPCARQRAGYAFATVALGLALLCDLSAVVVPVLALVLEAGLLASPWKLLVRRIVPWLAIAAGMALLQASRQPEVDLVFWPPIWARPLIAADALAYYTVKLLWPVPLAFDYGRSPQWLLAEPTRFGLALLPLGITMLLAWLPGRRMWLAAWGTMVAGLLPALGFVPFALQDDSTVADRFMYLAMLGPALGVAGLCSLPVVWPRVVLAVVPVWLWIAWHQTATWRDTRSACEHALTVNPYSTAAYGYLGIDFLDRDDPARALQLFAAGLAIRDDRPLLYAHAAEALLELGIELPLAIEHARRAVELQPRLLPAQGTLAALLARQGKYDEAYTAAQAALALDPEDPAVRYALGTALWGMERRDEARRQCPDLASYHLADARRFADLGRYELSLHHSRLAADIEPRNPLARTMLGTALLNTGRSDEAAGEFRAAVRLDPQQFEAHLGLARVLSLSRNPASLEHVRQAVALEPRNLDAHLALVDALLNSGDREAADHAFQQALRIAPATPTARSRLHNYARLLERGPAASSDTPTSPPGPVPPTTPQSEPPAATPRQGTPGPNGPRPSGDKPLGPSPPPHSDGAGH